MHYIVYIRIVAAPSELFTPFISRRSSSIAQALC